MWLQINLCLNSFKISNTQSINHFFSPLISTGPRHVLHPVPYTQQVIRWSQNSQPLRIITQLNLLVFVVRHLYDLQKSPFRQALVQGQEFRNFVARVTNKRGKLAVQMRGKIVVGLEVAKQFLARFAAQFARLHVISARDI